MFMFRSCGLVAISLSLAFALAGCGESSAAKKVSVKGKLVDGANPFILDATRLKLPAGAKGLPPGSLPLRITFIAADGGEASPANVDAASGTFSVSLVPGSYRIAVSASAELGSPDLFNNKFSTDRTQIRRDVKEGDEIVIDISKSQG